MFKVKKAVLHSNYITGMLVPHTYIVVYLVDVFFLMPMQHRTDLRITLSHAIATTKLRGV